jgi:hypothetical protein
MVDDTLMPVGFESRIAKTHLSGQERFAMACEFGKFKTKDTTQAAFLRHVMLIGLESLGWSEEKMIQEYAQYRVRCLRNGELNPFESE